MGTKRHGRLFILPLIIMKVFLFGESSEFHRRGEYISTIVSPEYPAFYPPDTHQEWIIQSDEPIIIMVEYLELEHPWDTLTVTHLHAHSSNLTRISLVNGNVTSLSIPSGETSIAFCSDLVEERGGFALNIRSQDTNSTFLQTDVEFACRSGLQYILEIARCDGVIDCHDYSDETDCDIDCKPDAYQCSGTDICILARLHCDGWHDCPLADDEHDCAAHRCPEGYSCGESPYNDRHGPTLPSCAQNIWPPFWINGTKPWTGGDFQQAAPKAVVLNLLGLGLRNWNVGAFNGLPNIHSMDISSNQIRTIPAGIFAGLNRLWKIVATNNSLTYIKKGAFSGLHNLRLLYLDINYIVRLDEGCFSDLNSLFFIDLAENHLSTIRPGTFKDIGPSLQRLVLTHNRISAVNRTIFDGVETNLQIVSFRENPLHSISHGTFVGLDNLRDLHVMTRSSSPIQLYPEIFDGLGQLQTLVVYDSRICCIAPANAQCVEREPAPPLFTCRKSFLQNLAIKIFIWILGISALFGNAFVIISRVRSKPASSVASVQSILITNLAFSDFLMGIYMIILATMDIYINESYFWEGRAAEWRSSTVCKIAGFITFLSSEASVFLLTLITIDRFICIVFPFSIKRLNVTSCRLMATICWIFALVLSLVSLLLNHFTPDAYALSDVCVGLPLVRKFVNLYSELDQHTLSQYGVFNFNTVADSTVSTWQFSIAVFLGINLLSFVAIVVCYAAIFIKVRLSRELVGRKSKTSEDTKLAIKLSLIICTDFCCWMPIIILGILVQADLISLTSDIYAWLVAFVLPINSSINPYIYTIVDKLGK